MTHTALDPTFADVADQSIASGVAALLTANQADMATSRLKAAGATYWPGQSTSYDLATVGVADVPGSEGVTSYDPSGTAQYSSDPQSVGLWLSTPVQRPMCVTLAWPFSANCKRVRIVMACSVTSPTGGVMDALGFAYDGFAWSPVNPGAEALEVESASTYPSDDPRRFNAALQATDAYREIGTGTATDGVTFAEFIVDVSARPAMDLTVQRAGDTVRQGIVGVALLSRIGTDTNGIDLANIDLHDPRNLVSIPSTAPNYIGAAHGILALRDAGTTGMRYYAVVASGPDPTDAGTFASAPDIAPVGDAWFYIWPPARETTFTNSELNQHQLFGNTVIRILSLTVQELPDA